MSGANISKEELMKQVAQMRANLAEAGADMPDAAAVSAEVPEPAVSEPVMPEPVMPEAAAVPAEADYVPTEVQPAPAAPMTAQERAKAAIASAAAEPVPVQQETVINAGQSEPAQAKAELPKEKKSHKGLIITLVVLALLALAVFLLTQVFFGIMKVQDSGMEDKISQGSYVLFNRMAKDPDVGDLIVILDEDGQKRVRYVAAKEGTTVDYDRFDRRLFVDDKVAADDYVKTMGNTIDFPYTVGNAEVFVLNENRDGADNEGVFPKGSIKGTVIMTF